MNFPRTVIGYYGCLEPLATDLLSGKMSLKDWPVSRNKWDWLGEGIYFWEHAPERALQWAKEEKVKKKEDRPAVIGAVIFLGDSVLDLLDIRFAPVLRNTYKQLVEDYKTTKRTLPENRGSFPALKRRDLDCLVINELCNASPNFYTVVRGAFEEGAAVFPGSKIMEQTHVQLAVRNTEAIKGLFRPV